MNTYTPSRCPQSLYEILTAPFKSTKEFDKFFEKYNYITTYRCRNSIYHILMYLKKKFNITEVKIPKQICPSVNMAIEAAGLKTVYGRQTNILYAGNYTIEDNAKNFKRPTNADFTVYSFGKGKDISSSEGGIVVINKNRFNDFNPDLKKPSLLVEIKRYIEYWMWKLRNYKIIHSIGKKIIKREPPKKITKINLTMCNISKKLAISQLKWEDGV